jgi:diguanylate cyclase (GGDEF)-like protein
MEKGSTVSPRPIPKRAMVISVAALAVPIAAQFFGTAADYDVLLWLLALVPAFMLAYHRGWSGVAAALATGMAVLALTQVALTATGRRLDNWPLLLGVVVAYIAISLAIGWISELLHRERERAERLALIDDLTGLPNRRLGRQFLEMEVAAAQRGRRITLVIFDLDKFKEYNDRHGHVAGDRAIQAMGRALTMNTRKMNMSARWGGEEFISILSDSTAPGAMIFVSRVQATLEAQTLEFGPVTVSAGVAEYGSGVTSVDDLVRAADEALYSAKEAGRNRAAVYEPHAASTSAVD